MAFEDIECVKPAGVAAPVCPADGVQLRARAITRKNGLIVQFIRLTIGAKLARGIALTQDSHGLRLLFGTGADAGLVMVSVDNAGGKFRGKRAKSGCYALTINASTAEGLFALQFPPFSVSPVEAIRQILALDPLKPVVSGVTLTTLAREFAAAQAVEDSDVMAERAACLAVMQAHLARLNAVAAVSEAPDIDDLQLELTRQTIAIDTVRQGLHRANEEEI